MLEISKDINTGEKNKLKLDTNFIVEEMIGLLPREIVFFPANPVINSIYLKVNTVSISRNY